MDIRRYFGGGASTKKSNDDDQSTSQKGGRSKKKNRAIIESDSDDDNFMPKKKQAVKESPPAKDKKKTKSPAKAEKKEVNIATMFGAGPVKRTAPKKITEIKQVEAVHDDEEFEKVLLTLDEDVWTNGDSEQKNAPAVSEVWGSPVKKEESASPAKKVTPQKKVEIPTKTSSPVKKQENVSSRSGHDETTSGKIGGETSIGKRDKSSPTDPKKSEDRTKNENERDKKKTFSQVSNSEKAKSSKETRRNTTPEKSKAKTAEQEDGRRDSQLSTKSSPNYPIKRKAEETSSASPNKSKIAKVGENRGKVVEPSKHPPVIQAPLTPEQRGELWVDKHKPTSLKQIIGQQGDNSNVQKLLRWLNAWHKNHGPGANKKLVRPSPWAKDHNGEFFKAALLSGPPGVGKTTTAHLVCKELGMDVVEFNASDTRSKKLMNSEVTELLSNRTLQPFFKSGGASKTSDRHVLIMDEVDGMAGNEDRGGVQELINLIKNAKCPVVCMCNDRQHPKVRSLANYCFDLRFYKPRIEQIRGRMLSVCFNEKIKIKPDALDEVIIGANQDIRQVLHHLAMWCSSSKTLSADQARADAHSAKKDIKVGPWDALRTVFSINEHKNMSFNDKSDLFFTDYNIMPLFVQDNYLRATPHACKNIHETLERVARAALSISSGDLIEKEIRSRNDAWGLLPVQAVFSCVAPGHLMAGHLAGQIQFPAWLGKNSNRGKLDRYLQELQTHMRLSISGGKRAVNLEYLHHLQNKLVAPLLKEGSAGVPTVLQTMQDYFLTREDLDNLFELNQWPGQPDPMTRIESKVKAALTRAYNKEGVVTPYAIHAPVKKKVGLGSAEDNFDNEDDGNESGEDNDDNAADAMIKAKTKAAEKPSKAAASTGASTSKRGGRGRGRGRGK